MLLHAGPALVGAPIHGRAAAFLRTVLAATKGPTRLGLLLIALAIALPTAPLAGETADILARLLGLVTICLLGWVALTALHIGADLYLSAFGSTLDGQSAGAQARDAGPRIDAGRSRW